METVPPHIEAAAVAAYVAYAVHSNESHPDQRMPGWMELSAETQGHWHAAVVGLLEAVQGSADLAQAERMLAAEVAAAGLFANAKCLVWSNAHGGWWHASRHGYTLDLTHAGRFTVQEAQEIVIKAGREALNPAIKAIPEVAVLAPEERWDSAPQIPDGAVRLDVVHEVTGLAGPRYLPFSLAPYERLQGLALQVYGSDVFHMPLTQHGNGPLHSICRRVDDDEPDRVDTVQA